jgi:hypothetical protein
MSEIEVLTSIVGSVGLSQGQLDDNVRGFFIEEVRINDEGMQQLIPILASIGINSMERLLGANKDQITAMKLKPITTKKLEKLLQVKQKSNISLQNKYYGGVNFKKNPTYFAWPETPAPEVKKEPENAVITRLITYSCIFTHFMYLLD